jgi:L-lactate dehydrogenase complex protein LldE
MLLQQLLPFINQMKVQLFIPCYVDQFYPQVGIATFQLLQKLGCEVMFPLNQTCCGQPMANAGFNHIAGDCNKNFIDNFTDNACIVCPSGSCALHVKEHLDGKDTARVSFIKKNVFELSEFIVDVLKIQSIAAVFPHKVGYHSSCHGQRGLHLSSMSELMQEPFSKPAQLLKAINGLELVYPDRPDECCGFGGTFCVTEEAVSVKMGKDRLQKHIDKGVEIITGNDMSCLMHLEGIISRNNYPLKVMHIAEILNQPLN